MVLKNEKCKVMPIGKGNSGGRYTIDSEARQRTIQNPTTTERDLEIEINNYLKPHNQVCKASSMVNKVLGVLKNNFSSRDRIL